jgi:hypothetical protein
MGERGEPTLTRAMSHAAEPRRCRANTGRRAGAPSQGREGAATVARHAPVGPPLAPVPLRRHDRGRGVDPPSLRPNFQPFFSSSSSSSSSFLARMATCAQGGRRAAGAAREAQSWQGPGAGHSRRCGATAHKPVPGTGACAAAARLAHAPCHAAAAAGAGAAAAACAAAAARRPAAAGVAGAAASRRAAPPPGLRRAGAMQARCLHRVRDPMRPDASPGCRDRPPNTPAGAPRVCCLRGLCDRNALPLIRCWPRPLGLRPAAGEACMSPRRPCGGAFAPSRMGMGRSNTRQIWVVPHREKRSSRRDPGRCLQPLCYASITFVLPAQSSMSADQ